MEQNRILHEKANAVSAIEAANAELLEALDSIGRKATAETFFGYTSENIKSIITICDTAISQHKGE